MTLSPWPSACVWAMTTALPELNFKVKGRGQTKLNCVRLLVDYVVCLVNMPMHELRTQQRSNVDGLSLNRNSDKAFSPAWPKDRLKQASKPTRWLVVQMWVDRWWSWCRNAAISSRPRGDSQERGSADGKRRTTHYLYCVQGLCRCDTRSAA